MVALAENPDGGGGRPLFGEKSRRWEQNGDETRKKLEERCPDGKVGNANGVKLKGGMALGQMGWTMGSEGKLAREAESNLERISKR